VAFAEIRIDTDQAAKDLTTMARALKIAGPAQLRKPLAHWGGYMLVRTDLLFATGSRDGVRWPRLKESTKASRRARGVKGASPLDATGALRRSIKTETVMGIGVPEQRVFSNNRLAAIHQEGALIGPRTIRPKTAKALRFVIGGQVVFARKADIKFTEIPARPIVFISRRDRETATRYVREHVQTLIRRAIKV
jgi:phage gpG-like protein